VLDFPVIGSRRKQDRAANILDFGTLIYIDIVSFFLFFFKKASAVSFATKEKNEQVNIENF
jgi:hypothetical protein